MNIPTDYQFQVEADYDIPGEELQIITGVIAMVWQHHCRQTRRFDVRIYSGQYMITPETPHGVQARFVWDTEKIEVWPDAIRAGAAAQQSSYPLMLGMYSAHEAMHAVQKARGEKPIASRLPDGTLRPGYAEHALEREAREAGLHAIKRMNPAINGSIVHEDGHQEAVPDKSMFLSFPSNRQIAFTVL